MFRIINPPKKSRMKLFTLLFLFTVNFVFSNERTNVVILINDVRMTNLEVRKMSEIIYLTNEYFVDNFSVLHFSNKSYSNETWSKKKKSVSYKSTMIDCNFDICSKITGIIDYTRTVDSKLYITDENSINCNFAKNYIEIKQLINNQYSTIADEIKSEIKSVKKEKTLFFYFSGRTQLKTEILFQNDTIISEESSDLKLTPLYKSNYISYKWNTSNGLSCYDCKYPNFTGTKSNEYHVICTDSLGCEIKSKNIYIKVINKCQNGFQACKFILDDSISPKYRFVNKKGTADHDWNIAANSAGGLQFDFVATSNCADRYLVEVIDLNGNTVVWKKNYNKNDVDQRSNNDLHKIYPNNNVFRLTLYDLEDKIIPPKEGRILYFFRVRITSYDNLNNQYEKYTSPRLLFSHCDH